MRTGQHKLIETVPVVNAKYIEDALVKLRNRGMTDDATISIHAG